MGVKHEWSNGAFIVRQWGRSHNSAMAKERWTRHIYLLAYAAWLVSSLDIEPVTSFISSISFIDPRSAWPD